MKPIRPVSRRAFLRQTTLSSVAISAPWIVPAGASGADGVAPANNRINVAFLGTGRQVFHANLLPFLVHPDTQVVALCDVDARRLAATQRKVEEHYSVTRPTGGKGLQITTDFREVLARKDVDAVMISTPDHWHAYMAVEAARAGKDVALEKPISLSIQQGRAISAAMTKYRRIFSTDTEVRTEGAFRKLAELVRNGRLGKVRSVRVGVPHEQPVLGRPPRVSPVPPELDFPLWLGPAPDATYSPDRVHPPATDSDRGPGRPGWMQIQDYSEGMILNWGAHLVDIAQWALDREHGGPVEVEGTGVCPDDLYNVPQSFEVRYRYADGVDLFYSMAGRPFVRIEGTDGWAEAEWWKGIQASKPEILDTPWGSHDLRLKGSNEKVDFIEAVKSRRETQIPAETGHRTCTICHLGFLALQLGRKLKWNPVTERFLDDPEADRRIDRPMRDAWQLAEV